jgi:hypothetical protein
MEKETKRPVSITLMIGGHIPDVKPHHQSYSIECVLQSLVTDI